MFNFSVSCNEFNFPYAPVLEPSDPTQSHMTAPMLTTITTPIDFAIDVGRNVCHGSDSVENAKKEIALWFKDGDVISWKSAQNDWIYEK
jgi:hypothetical protein